MSAVPSDRGDSAPAEPRPPRLAAAHSYVDAMPFEPALPCPVCRSQVDPLRAPAVLALETGFRYFCGRACLEQYRTTEPSRRLAVMRPSAVRPVGARGEELVQAVPAVQRAEPPAPTQLPVWLPWLVLPVCAIAFFPDTLLRAGCVAVLLGALVWVLGAARNLHEEFAWSGVWLPAAGVVSLAAAGLGLSDPWLLATSGLGVILCWARELLAQRAQTPLDALLAELAERVPRQARVSLTDAQDADSYATRNSTTESVRAGEEVAVEAGEVVPVDGVVAQGEATVLLHPAAKMSVVRRQGDALLAGARVLEGSVRVTATRVGSARALFRPPSFGQELATGAAGVVRAVARGKAPWVAALYAGVVVALALTFRNGLFATCATFGTAMLALPVLSLVRGVRLSFVSASALGASRGIVFRDAATLERAGRVGAAALSTDRTVTTGACNLVEVSPLGREHSANELTALAMGAESAVEDHPIARAITAYGQERGIAPALLRRVAYARGRGVTALVEGGGALVLGNRQALLNAGVSVAVADREAQRAEAMGRTVVFLAVGGRVRALFVLEDPVRPEARAAVQTLIDLDVEVVLLAGDHRTTVESLARPLDITHIKAELTSEERAQEVTRLRDAGVVVAVIGHAPDDELAFATSDVALTLDAAGGVHEGDIAVGSDDLRDAADALVLAQRARRNVQTVLALTLGGGLALATVAALGVGHPALVLALSLGIDAWALPSPARLLRRRKRMFGATRSGVGLMRRA